MIIISPTGKGVRYDGFGSGDYNARRKRSDGSRYRHQGTDYICKPGQRIYAPATAIFKRISYPYASSQEYIGGVFKGKDFDYKMFYFICTIEPGTEVKQGEVIGCAQNISKKYGLDAFGNSMVAHVHLEINPINPVILMT